MEKAIESAMEILAAEVKKDMKADDALKFTQAMCNLSHVLLARAEIRKAEREPPTA